MSAVGRIIPAMTGQRILETVVEMLERWGWVQHATAAADGFDIVGAFEESTGLPLRNSSADEDAVISAFAHPACDASATDACAPHRARPFRRPDSR